VEVGADTVVVVVVLEVGLVVVVGTVTGDPDLLRKGSLWLEAFYFGGDEKEDRAKKRRIAYFSG